MYSLAPVLQMCVQVLQHSIFSVLFQVRMVRSAGSMKTLSDLIGNRTSALPAFTRLPQQTAPPCALYYNAQN